MLTKRAPLCLCELTGSVLGPLQVSATFAASLVTSPAIGAYLSATYGDSLVVLVATIIAVLDICFVLLVVPESLPDKMRLSSWGFPISWEQADPFAVSVRPHTHTHRHLRAQLEVLAFDGVLSSSHKT